MPQRGDGSREQGATSLALMLAGGACQDGAIHAIRESSG